MGPSQGWNILILIATIGGLLGLYFLTYSMSVKPSEEDSAEHVWDEDLREAHNPLPRWWIGLFYITLVFAVLYLVLYPGIGSLKSLLGWSEVSQYRSEMQDANALYGPRFERYLGTPIPQLADDEDALLVGRRLFSAYCTTCHGSDARGVTGFPNLTDDDWLHGGEPASIEKSILDGRQGVMPSWMDALGSEEALAEVTQYVLSLSGHATEPEKAKAGKARFEQLCAACHGPQGRGNPQLGAPNLTDDTWLYGGSAAEVAQSIAQGRQGRMPPHRGFLGEAKSHLLAAYVYSLSHRSEGR